jgi:MFS transporter, UMF1 family
MTCTTAKQGLDNPGKVLSWALYDWANSAFATTVMAGFFPMFFKKYWSIGTDINHSTAFLGLANSAESLIVAIAAPFLGAIADKSTSKKKFLIVFAFMGALMTCALRFVQQGSWPLAAVLYAAGAIGFSGGNIFYDAMITDVASEKRLDMVSSVGYALGYLGGGILFAVNIWMYLRPVTFGLADGTEAVRISFLTVGIWWALFTIPLILFVKEPAGTERLTTMQVIKAGLSQVGDTFSHIRQNRMVFLFLLAYWFYIDGIDTIVRMAVDCGISLGFNDNSLITALLLVQFIGFPAAIGYGYLGNRIGAKRGILIAIVVYVGITIWGALMKKEIEFYLLAAAIGLVQGGIQALSRSYYATIIPADKSAEYFGFYNMLGKCAAIIGPLMVGGISVLVARVSGSSSLGTRVSIASLSLLLLAGGLLLYFVHPDRQNKPTPAIT